MPTNSPAQARVNAQKKSAAKERMPTSVTSRFRPHSLRLRFRRCNKIVRTLSEGRSPLAGPSGEPGDVLERTASAVGLPSAADPLPQWRVMVSERQLAFPVASRARMVIRLMPT